MGLVYLPTCTIFYHLENNHSCKGKYTVRPMDDMVYVPEKTNGLTPSYPCVRPMYNDLKKKNTSSTRVSGWKWSVHKRDRNVGL